MGKAEKFFGITISVFMFILIGVIIFCLQWLQKLDDQKDKIIFTQDSVIVKQQYQIDSLKQIKTRKHDSN